MSVAWFTDDTDRKVKVYVDDVAVISGNAESDYARPLNFNDRFTVTANTLGSTKVFDVTLTYADKIIPYEAGVAKGSTPGWLNFDGNHFDVSSLASQMYTVTSTGWVKVNSLTVKPLAISNATNHECVTVTENAGDIGLVFRNDEVDVFQSGSLVTAQPRRLQFSTGFTLTDDAANDRIDIALASTGSFLPIPTSSKWGMMYGAQNLSDPDGFPAGDGLLNIPYVTIGAGNAVTGGYDPTHGVYRRYTLGSDDNDAIKIMSGSDITNRAANPHIYCKMRLNVYEDHRFFMGWHTGTIPDGDDNFLDNLIGFGWGEQSDLAATEDTQWRIIRNDGDATADKANSGITIAASTVFTFELVADAANSRWGWNVNGGAFTYYTTEIPTTQDLRFTWQFEEIGSEEPSIDIFYLYWTQDK